MLIGLGVIAAGSVAVAGSLWAIGRMLVRAADNKDWIVGGE
jgi:hypothetical protein